MADKTESAADDYTLQKRDTDAFAHESHFKGYEGLFFLRTKNNKIFKLKDTCVWAKERGGFTGNVEEMIGHVYIFFREVVVNPLRGFTSGVCYANSTL
jgi:hypothetical protein